MASTNVRLLNASLRRSLYIQRFGSHLVESTVGFLNEILFPELVSLLSARLERIKLRGYDSGVEATKKYASLLADVEALTQKGTEAARKVLAGNLRELAKVESKWAVDTLQSATPPALGVSFEGLNMRAVQQVVQQNIQGKTMEEWFDNLAGQLQHKIEQELGKGLAIGETVDQMIQRIRGTRAADYEDGVLQTTRRGAEAIVRTAANHVSAQAREQTYAENADVLKGIQWVSTLDTRTTEICRQLDGKVFEIGEGQRPPAHWNCRSTTVPITKSWRELGIKANDAEASTRASMDGQVPETVTYATWIESQPAAVQRLAGSERSISMEQLERTPS